MESIINRQPLAAATIQSLDAEKVALGSVTASLEVVEPSAVAKTVVAASGPPVTTLSGDGARVLTLSEYKAAARTLAEAFKKDHTTLYFTHTPDRSDWTEQQKWDLHLSMMEYITYAHLLKGEVVSAGPDYASVALW